MQKQIEKCKHTRQSWEEQKQRSHRSQKVAQKILKKGTHPGNKTTTIKRGTQDAQIPPKKREITNPPREIPEAGLRRSRRIIEKHTITIDEVRKEHAQAVLLRIHKRLI